VRRLAFEWLEDRRVLSGLAGGAVAAVDTLAASAASAAQQVITASPSSQSANPGQAVSIDVNYTTSDGDATLTGLGLRLHYNSLRLSYESLTSVLASPVQQQAPTADTDNYDGDSSTDKYVLVSWINVSGNWPGSIPVKLYTANFTAVASATGNTYVRFSASSTAAGYTLSSTPGGVSFVTPSTIVSRHLFYNNSSFDGNSAAANASDDNAIATDKSALLIGQKATFQNYSSYSGGINGVMVDFDNLSGTPTASDFQFLVGNSSTTTSWTAPASSPTVSVRTNVGTGVVDRVTLVWADGAISGKWLQVTVLATSRTAITAPSVFYFGNAPGETGDSTTDAAVEGDDYVTTRSLALTFTGTASITNAYDFNRDGTINASDVLIVRGRMGHVGSSLKLITPTGGTSIVTSASATDATAAVASLVADTSTETLVTTVDTSTVESESASESTLDPALVTVPVERIDALVDAERVPTALAATLVEEDTEAVASAAGLGVTDALRAIAARRAAERAAELIARSTELFARDSVFEDWIGWIDG
jgi:hypothetical protein